ncbi:MAG: DUF4314 domain-containing protein [Clostridia bacterium]
MKNFPTREQVDRIKEQFPVGTVVELKEMQDPYNPVPSGTRGVITGVDDGGSLLMKWSNGRTLSLIVGEDDFDVITHNTVINQEIKGSMTAWVAQNQGDVGERLFLPNTYEKIIKVCEKANQNPENCYVSDSYTKSGTTLLQDKYMHGVNLFELNFLARKLEDLDEIEMFGFNGMIEYLEESQDLPSLINLAMNCKDMQGVDISPATTDEELGEFYIDAGLIEEIQRMPYEFREWVTEHLDAQKVGEDIRDSENGFFTENAYISQINNELLDLYDGIIRMPENEEQIEDMEDDYSPSQGMSMQY